MKKNVKVECWYLAEIYNLIAGEYPKRGLC
jgi:hypothetical protein